MKKIAEITEARMADIRDLIGKRVRQARKAVPLTQSKLAIKAGVSLTTINRLEKGKQIPHGSNLAEILKVLNLNDLINDLEKTKSSEAKSIGLLTADEIAEAVAKKLTKPEPTGDRAELLRLIGTLDDDGIRIQLKTVRNYLALKQSKRNDSSGSGS